MKLYKLLTEYDLKNQESYHMGMMRIPDEVANRVLDAEKPAFDSIQKAMTVAIRQENNRSKLESAVVLYGVGRSYGPEDFTEADYDNLFALDLDKLPLVFRARIADVLWIQKINYQKALIAIDAYILLFESSFTIESWPDGIEIIERALSIARSIKNEEKKEEVLRKIHQCLKNSIQSNEIVLLLKLISILIEHKYGDPSEYISIISNLKSTNADNILSIEKAFEQQLLCYKWENDQLGAERTQIQLAEYYEETANRQDHNDVRGLSIAIDLLKKAYDIYKKKKRRSDEQRILSELDKIQKDRPSLFQKLTYQVDMSEPLHKISDALEGMTAEESLVFLVMLVQIHNREKLKEQIFEDGFISTALFSQELTDKHGRTVSKIKPLDYSDPDKDPDLLDQYLWKRASDLEDTNGFLLRFAIQEIQKKQPITREPLQILTEQNGIIPDGREEVILSALELFFNGHPLEAMYILIPQVEHMFRVVAKEVGGITTKLMDDHTEEELSLGEILKIPELVDAYDEDLLFTMKGLMISSAGSNIRNMIAHGLVDQEDTRSGAFYYCICFIMRILALTARECQRVLHGSEKLKGLISNGDDNS